jgi:hypothetical protein
LRLDLKNNATGIVDAVGNPITGGFSSGEHYIIGEPQGFRTADVSDSSIVNNINEPAKSIQATVYPNPFSNDATFSFTLAQTEAYIIKFYDSRGFQIAQVDKGTANANVAKNVKIDGSGLAAGLYMVSIQTSHDIKFLKLVKE